MTTSNRPTLSIVVAMAENRVIGKNNQLPWHLPNDLKHFKALTTGNPVLMGRKTYQSIGKPLPNRLNIIMTHQATFKVPGCLIVSSLDDMMLFAETNLLKEIFIIGGAEIYRQCLPQTDRIYLTIVHENFDGDTYFPELDMQEWQEISVDRHEADAENPYAYSFLLLQRKEP